MKDFFDFATREDFQRLIDEATNFASVQGVTIDYDPAWLHLAMLRQRLSPGLFDLAQGQLFSTLVRGWSLPAFWSGPCAELPAAVGLPLEPLDTAWLPTWWPEFNKLHGRRPWKSPIVVRICLLPWTERQEVPRFEGYEFPILLERRPQAQLCHLKTPRAVLEGGLSIGVGPQISGTLGGIVEDQHGVRYGVTCAHVIGSSGSVDQPAQADHVTPNVIGSVGPNAPLQTSQPSTPCNPKNNRSVMNKVDAALIKLSNPANAQLRVASLGALTRVVPEMNVQPASDIYFVGKESGPQARRLVTGGLNVTYRFKDANGDCLCFENTFQVRWPNNHCPLGAAAVEQGDSGAWLCSPDGNGYAWAGIVMGSDQFIGYGISRKH